VTVERRGPEDSPGRDLLLTRRKMARAKLRQTERPKLDLLKAKAKQEVRDAQRDAQRVAEKDEVRAVEKVELRFAAKLVVRAVVRVEVKAEVKAEAKAEARVEAKAEAKEILALLDQREPRRNDKHI
jgi:hypothetical protein